MARITSKSMLTNYIYQQLGAPNINIEVTTDQISQIIDDTVLKFTEFAYGVLEETIILQINGKGDYPMPDNITNIIKISKGSTSNITNFASNFGANYVPDLWSQQFFTGSLTGDIIPAIISISTTKAILDAFFSDDVAYNFNPWQKNLHVFENYVGGAVMHYQYEYLANENQDFIYNHEWVKEFAVAKTKFLWGSIVGKYDQALVGGARINFADIKSEAQETMDRLREELYTRWSDPCPILIGSSN
jgi:hypothetical protein